MLIEQQRIYGLIQIGFLAVVRGIESGSASMGIMSLLEGQHCTSALCMQGVQRIMMPSSGSCQMYLEQRVLLEGVIPGSQSFVSFLFHIMNA